MSFDITNLLREWEYQAGQIVVRRFLGRDGKEKIQLRLDLGILQMNASGRPDGKQPFGHASLFEHYQRKLDLRAEAEGEDSKPFKLSGEDCASLHQEAIQFHHRYICLFQLEDFKGVLRDTERNLAVYEFVKENAESPEMLSPFQQLRPQLMMMRTRARGSMALEAGRHEEAADLAREGIEELRAFYLQAERPELADASGEIASLEGWVVEIERSRPLSVGERLQRALQEAIAREDYEEAARLRDQINQLKHSPKS